MENIPDMQYGRTCREHSVQTKAKISAQSSKNSAKSKTVQPLFLDLRTGGGDGVQQDLSWQTDIQSLGVFSMHNFGESPNAVEESSLWQILEVEVPEKYYLSKTACRGVLRRAANRGVELPPILLMALISQGEITEAELTEMGITPPIIPIENHPADSRVTLCKEETIQTLTSRMGTGGGNTPLLLIGVDTYNQTLTGNVTKTLLAGHIDPDGVPCVAINMLQDAVPNESITPCLSTGNPKTGQANVAVCYPEMYSIDRAAFNQGKNAQYKIQIDDKGISHTLVAKGPGAVCYPVSMHGDTAGTLDSNYWKGCGERNGTEREIIAQSVQHKWIVRRVIPVECARLQGMPDWWCTDLKRTDSAEYKMWGNGMALPCVLYVMQGIAKQLRKSLLEVMK